MASLDSSIEIKQEVRPCFINGKKALFHMWIKKIDYLTRNESVKGLVEFEDGRVEGIEADNIRFCDYRTREFAFRGLDEQDG